MPVEIDLYKDDLSSFGDPELFEAVEAFTRVKLPANDRTQEGYLVDFKATWSVSALQTVAAFANTFGGLLLVGVSDTNGRADQIVGIVSQRQELKTSIASSIASNISPTPAYEVRDVAFPSDPARHLCIVRVRKGNSLYLLTQKGSQPVYIRNEDESRPADAARLQALLATRDASGLALIDPSLSQQSSFGTHDLYVTCVKGESPEGQRFRSETYLQITVQPEAPQLVRLDRAVEQRFLSVVRTSYPDLAGNVDDRARNSGASFTETRSRDWYQVTYFEGMRDYEIQWGIDSRGSVYFVTQVRCRVQEQDSREVWSLCDLMTNLDCTVEAAHQFWEYLNYPGEGRVLAELHVESLSLLTRPGGTHEAYASAFYECGKGRSRAKLLFTDALVKTVKQGSRATAAVDLTYATRFGSHAEPVALLTNGLLRDLGYAANLADLRAVL